MKIETKRKDLLFWVILLTSIISLSMFFNAPDYYESGNITLALTISIVSIIVFTLTMVYMTFRIYAQEKLKNNLKQNISFYEKLYSKFCSTEFNNTKENFK